MMNRYTPEIQNAAVEIARFVISSGRVEGEGQEWLDSLGVEVEYEASERGFDFTDANMISGCAVDMQMVR